MTLKNKLLIILAGLLIGLFALLGTNAKADTYYPYMNPYYIQQRNQAAMERLQEQHEAFRQQQLMQQQIQKLEEIRQTIGSGGNCRYRNTIDECLY